MSACEHLQGYDLSSKVCHIQHKETKKKGLKTKETRNPNEKMRKQSYQRLADCRDDDQEQAEPPDTQQNGIY